jgi:hypothetical protein
MPLRTSFATLKQPLQAWGRSLERRRFVSVWDRMLDHDSANRRITALVADSAPCLIARIGHTEGRIVGEYHYRQGRYGRKTRHEAHQYSGIFPVSKPLLDRFACEYGQAIGRADLLGFWQTSFQAQLLAQRYPSVPLTALQALEPYLHPQPWSSALAGRRVLVVHPFAETIHQQYQRHRLELFANPATLPAFDLQVLAPPQTLAPATAGYENWFAALDELTDRVLAQRFDLALLGCGAYGLPLGAAIKAAGGKAVHLGGALQVLFGIRGRRWEQMPAFVAMMNDSWVRPLASETPAASSQVDGACYW